MPRSVGRGPAEVVIPAVHESARPVNAGGLDVTTPVTPAVGGRTRVMTFGCTEAVKGASVLRTMRTGSATFVGSGDADLSPPVSGLIKVAAELRHGATAASASRQVPGESLVPGTHATRCGFRFLGRRGIAGALARCETAGFVLDVELSRHIHVGGPQISEIPGTCAEAHSSTLLPLPTATTGAVVVETAGEVARRTADSGKLSVVESGRG